MTAGSPGAVAAGHRDRPEPSVGWQVEVLDRQPGQAGVIRRSGHVYVRVVDGAPAGSGGATRSLLAADLAADGSAHLVARCSPPALVLSDSGVRPLPAGGSGRATISLQRGDRLVMCSAASLEGEPDGVVSLLRAGPGSARRADLRWLVRTLLRGSDTGAAAVIRRT